MKTSFEKQDITLTQHFKLSEFLESSTIVELNDVARRDKLIAQQTNIPVWIVANLTRLTWNVLEKSRLALGYPIIVNSGYRSPALNKLVGGVASSQHTQGEAADIRCFDNKALFEYILNNCEFDQLICYGQRQSPRFIHVSYVKKGNRKQVIYKD